MKQFELLIQTSEGNTYNHSVPALSSKDAVKVFKKYFRENGEEVIEARETGHYALPLKEQEREAADKIASIIEEMGEESYIARAFEGCVDMAHENIDNDWANSWSAKIDNLENKANQYMDKYVAANALNTELSQQLDRYKQNHAEIEVEFEKLHKELGEKRMEIKALNETIEELKTLELENMKLKAKLYDIMATGA